MIVVELAYPVRGETLPRDHGYALYSAISKCLEVHLPAEIALMSIGGTTIGPNKIRIGPGARLRIRAPAETIGDLLHLSGKFLEVGGHEIGLGIPNVHAFRPAPTLVSRLVTIKKARDPESFLQAARKQMEILGIGGEPEVPIVREGPRQGEHRRRVITIKDRVIIGFAMVVRKLSEKDSYTLLAHGLGGRRHMGCGIFVPAGGPGEDGNAL